MQMFLLLLVFIVIINYRLLIMMVLSPLTLFCAYETKICDGKFGGGKNIHQKVRNYFCSQYRQLKDRLFLKWLSEVPSIHIRHFFYKYVYLITMGKNVTIHYGAEIREPHKLKLGNGVVIGDHAILDARCGIEIGDNVCFASNVSIWTLQHDYRDPYFNCNEEHVGMVKIGNRAWIGPNSIILRKVSIGEGAVVAAGSVVSHSVEEYTVVAGIPAKPIRKRPNDLRYEFGHTMFHFL